MYDVKHDKQPHAFECTIWNDCDCECIWMYDIECLNLWYETFMENVKHFCYWMYDVKREMKLRAFECTLWNDFECIWYEMTECMIWNDFVCISSYDMKHFRNIQNISAIECTIWNIMHLNVWQEMTLSMFEGTIWNIYETFQAFPLLSVQYETSCIRMYDTKWLWMYLKVRYETFPKHMKHFRYWVYDMKHHAFECTIWNQWMYDMKWLKELTVENLFVVPVVAASAGAFEKARETVENARETVGVEADAPVYYWHWVARHSCCETWRTCMWGNSWVVYETCKSE